MKGISASFTTPSVIKNTPDSRSAETSPAASRNASTNSVPSRPASSTRRIITSGGAASPASACCNSASASALCPGRTVRLCDEVSSITMITASREGIRFSSRQSGLASAATSAPSATARSAQPDNPRHAASSKSASASPASPAKSQNGSIGSKAIEFTFIAPAFPAGPAHAPDRIYNCRSSHT